MKRMINEFKKFKDKSTGDCIVKATKFSIGDIVNVKDFGCCYHSYKQAFRCMNGDEFHFSNVEFGLFDRLHIFIFGRIKDDKNNICNIIGHNFYDHMNWKVGGICLHADRETIVYLLLSSVGRLGLIIEEEGLVLKHKSINEITQEYFVAS